jgi:hypothetical protein
MITHCFHRKVAEPHDLMSSRIFGLLKTSEVAENKGIFRFLLDEQKASRNPPGPDRP